MELTPKQKAEELVEKFSDLEDGEMYIGKEKILNPHIDKWYYKTSLKNNSGIRNTFLLHRIIAKRFLFDYNENLKANHKDGNKLNNKIENKYNEFSNI